MKRIAKLAASGLLVLTSFYLIVAGAEIDISVSPTATPLSVVGDPPQIKKLPPAFETFRSTLTRPLFHPGRRPFVEKIAIPAAPAFQPLPVPALLPPQGITLRGTVLAGNRSALFERNGGRDYIRLQEGQRLDEWTLVSVAQQHVVFEARGQTITMTLAKDQKG